MYFSHFASSVQSHRIRLSHRSAEPEEHIYIDNTNVQEGRERICH